MNNRYKATGLVVIIVLATVLISGCIGTGETETNNISSNSEKNTNLVNDNNYENLQSNNNDHKHDDSCEYDPS